MEVGDESIREGVIGIHAHLNLCSVMLYSEVTTEEADTLEADTLSLPRETVEGKEWHARVILDLILIRRRSDREYKTLLQEWGTALAVVRNSRFFQPLQSIKLWLAGDVIQSVMTVHDE
jgi:hypothetical protein